MSIHFVFIVTGTNIHGVKSLYSAMAVERAKYWADKLVDARFDADAIVTAGDTVRFVHFKCQDDIVRVVDLDLALKGDKQVKNLGGSKWKALKDFVATGDPNFDPKNLVDAVGTAGITMPQVYSSIRKVGTKAPHSLLELAIFSHAFVDGPMLRTSPDGGKDDEIPALTWTTGEPKRSAKDPNGRARTDFQPNMGEDPTGKGKNALTAFKNAFTNKSTFVIFGCEGSDAPRVTTTIASGETKNRPWIKSTAGELINAVYRKTLRSKTSADKAVADLIRGKKTAVLATTVLAIDMGAEFTEEAGDVNASQNDHTKGHDHHVSYEVTDKGDLKTLHYGMDSSFFPTPSTPPPSPPDPQLKLNKSWAQVLGVIARLIKETYAFKAAEVLAPEGVTVLGGPPGTHTKDDSSGQMAVCQDKASKSDECMQFVTFYRDFLRSSSSTNGNASQDDINRRYFIFDKNTLTFINTLAAVT
jgi:hypothetical protein